MLMAALGTMQLLKCCGCWTAFIVCVINNIFLQSKGWGGGLGYFEKLTDQKTISIYERSLTFLIYLVPLHNKVSKGCVHALRDLQLVSFLLWQS